MSSDLLAARILIVVDDEAVLQLCRTILQFEGYRNIETIADPRGVVSHFVENQPDLMILDIMMPHLDGFELLEMLQRALPEGLTLPVLIISAMANAENCHTGFLRGAIDVIRKPFNAQDLVLRVRNLLRIRLACRDAQEQSHALFLELLERTEELSAYQLELKEAQLEVIDRLGRAGEQRDDDTGRHTQRVAIVSALIADGLSLSFDVVESIQRAAPLHDVGKIGVPDAILLKPGRLTDEEHRCMRRHCEIGANLLSGGRSEILQVAERIALNHHEKWNGQGYPIGLAGDEIPIEGRILAVADVFDALTHERPYKKAWTITEATAEIERQAGQHFDPQVVRSFLKLPHAELV